MAEVLSETLTPADDAEVFLFLVILTAIGATNRCSDATSVEEVVDKLLTSG